MNKQSFNFILKSLFFILTINIFIAVSNIYLPNVASANSTDIIKKLFL